MAEIRNYSHAFLKEFIAVYQEHPCLWKVRSKYYNNRSIKSRAYEKLINKFREVEPMADKDFVLRKINSLRGAFRRELRRVRSAQAAGQDYQPNLWYFHLLLFTSEQEESALDYVNETFFENELFEEIVDAPLKLELRETGEDSQVLCAPKRRSSDSERIKRRFEEVDAVACNVSAKLRHMETTQRLLAEKIINDVLFKGQFGLLTMEDAYAFASSAASPCSPGAAQPPPQPQPQAPEFLLGAIKTEQRFFSP